MGVKFGREYEDIMQDLTLAISQIEESFTFFEMTLQQWNALDGEEQQECLKTLADDVFFALGTNARVKVGKGILIYEKSKHRIAVDQDGKVIQLVNLI